LRLRDRLDILRGMALKHRWRVDNNPLVNITTGNWWRLLRENRFAVDPAYWHRAAFITVQSAFNYLEALMEERRWGAAVDATKVEHPPLFILGHWRSGTTHLHNLLACDPQFAYPGVAEAFFPHSLLTMADARQRWWARRPTKTRVMDAVSLAPHLPQEDEWAMALTCLRSPYVAKHFPRRCHDYERYISFRGVPETELEEWKRSFMRFLKKLTLKHGRPLLLKSPAHTARIRHLLALFPRARFVFLHRDPLEVFQSFRHHFDTLMWFFYLQVPDVDLIDEAVLRVYSHVFDAFFEDRGLIPPGQYHEVGFTDLEQRPIDALSQIYEKLGLDGFARARPRLEAYLATLAGYKKNRFPPLDAARRERVTQAWRRTFEEWGYSM